MNRLLLGVLVLLSAAQAQEVETGLAAVRQRLRSHPVAQRKLSGRQHRAALVSGTLGETAAALERLEGPDASRQLTYLRERLLTASRSIETDFASIEAALAGLGLPEKLEAWHEFVRHYRGRLAEVDAELTALAANGNGLSSSELRRRLAALRAKFGADAQPRIHESVRGAGLAGSALNEPPAVPPIKAGPRLADDLPMPGPADLAESKVVLLTPEIRTLAAALGGNPIALYNWVATHTEYVPYVGQMQNSLSVLWSHRGNDFDHATLLIALLRASGIPARYLGAHVLMSRADVRDWMGVKDDSILLGLLSRGLDFSLFRLEADKVVASRAGVGAYLDVGAGRKLWMVMDPATKRRRYQPGIVLSRPPYDRMAYLKAFKPVVPAEPYLDLLRADLQKRFPGRGFNEVPYTGTLLPPPPPTVEEPYPVVEWWFDSTPEMPEVFRHKINLSLSEYGRPNLLLNLNLSLPEIVLQSLTLSYVPATAADRMVAEAFGGMESAPAAVVNLLPEIRLAGQVIALGKTPIPAAAAMDLTVTPIPVAQSKPGFASHNIHTAGETAAVVLGANQIGEQLVADRISSFLKGLPAATAAEATRRLLDVAALRYLHRMEIDEQRLSDALQVRFIQAGGVENAIAFASLEPQNLFDRPFVVTPGRLRIHSNPGSLPLVDLNRSDQTGPVLRIAWQLHNDAASALEHEIWEELVMIPSVSTIKILQTAIQDNIPIRTINRDNAAAEMPNIVAAPSTKAAMQQKINEGATLTAPRRPVTIGAWKWQGWIEEFAGWDFAYRIDNASLSGPAPGGDTGGIPPPPRPPAQEPGTVGSPTETNGTTCSDPVNISNGNLIESIVDYRLPWRGPTLDFVRTYNSLSPAAGPLGPGWRHNYQISLKDNRTAVQVINESGGTMSFALVNGAYTSPPGYNLALTKDGEGYRLRRPSGIEFRFDPQGLLQSITSRNRNALQLSHDTAGLRRLTDGTGRGVVLNYDGAGRLTSLVDFTGRRIGYEYDAAGRLIGVVDAAGNRTSYAYYTDAVFNHLLRSATTPEGNTSRFEYYGNRKVSRTTLPDGRTINFLYLPLRNETHLIDPEGRLTSYRYNALGNVVSVTHPDGSRADSVYSEDAKLVEQTDAAGYTTRFNYDKAGNLLSAADPLGRTLRLTWDPATNLLTSYQNARGIVTRFEYDSRGNLLRTVQPLGVETRQTWDAAGSLTSVTDAEGRTFTAAYDSYGNQSESRDALGNATAFEFDRLNRLTRTVDPEGGESRGEYDALDRVVREVNPLGLAAAAAYDRDGRATGTTDFGGRARKFRFDSMDHLTQAIDPLGQTTEYGYKSPECACPASANLSVFRDAGGTARSQTYDSQGRLTAATDPLGNTARYQYDSRGDIARKTDANGNATAFEYDAAGQLTRKVFADGTDVRFSYDASGNLLTAANRHVTFEYTYDELDRVVRVTDSRFGKRIEYGYNRVGLRTSMTDSDGGVTRYSYDANRRLVSLTAPSGHEIGFDYDARGNQIAIRYPGEQTATLRYDAGGRVGEVKNAGGAFAYSYDKAGNPLEIGGAAGSQVFQYDELDRLTAALRDSSPAESYTYDAAGNRKSSATDPAYRYDAAGRLLAAEDATFAYDKNGNLVRRTTPNGTTTYTWNAENQLARVELPGGGAVTYKCDPFGRRIEKNVSGRVTAWLYDRDNILAEMDEGGLVRARYTHGAGVDQPLALERDGQTWFFQADAGGNVVALLDAAGSLVRSFAYDSWGRPLSAEESGPASPFRFAGREYDPESGLYYMRARYYDPSVGRFISADPLDLPGMLVSGQSTSNERALLPQAAAEVLRRAGVGPVAWLRAQAQRVPERLNAYAYAGNNPLRWRDPSGLDYCIKSQIVTRYIVDENGVWHAIWTGRVEWEESTNPLFQVVKFLAGLLPDKPAPPGSIVTVYVGPVTVRPAPVLSVVAADR